MESLSSLTDIEGMFSVDDYMHFYGAYLNAERSAAETHAVVDLLQIDSPMRVLDLACGFGRIANRLALLGNRVTGVELLPGFVELARSTARQVGILDQPNGPSVRFIQGDMRQMDFKNEFDRVIMMFNSFGYFTDEENADLLRRIRRSLVPGGLLGFDIGSRDGVLFGFQPQSVWESPDGTGMMVNRFSFDPSTGRLRNDRVVFRDGMRMEKPFSIRLYTVQELQMLLREAGMELTAVYGEWDRRELTIESTSMVVIARAINL